MIHEITKVDSLSAAKMSALLSAAMTLIFIIPFALISLLTSPNDMGFSFGFILLMPILYAFLGYLFGLFGAAVYNFVARQFGGLKLTLSQAN